MTEATLRTFFTAPASVVEDGTIAYQLWGEHPLGSAVPLHAIITRLPARGALFYLGRQRGTRLGAINVTGYRITEGYAFVEYVPEADASGNAFDSFAYTLEASGDLGGVSNETAITVDARTRASNPRCLRACRITIVSISAPAADGR